MKKLGLTIGMVGVMCLFTPLTMQAQKNIAKTATTPAEELSAKAERHAIQAKKELGLNEEQQSKFKKFDIDRLYKVQSINEKIKLTSDQNEKEQLKAEKKKINEEFFDNVNTILTPAQQEIWKKKREELINHKHENK